TLCQVAVKVLRVGGAAEKVRTLAAVSRVLGNRSANSEAAWVWCVAALGSKEELEATLCCGKLMLPASVASPSAKAPKKSEQIIEKLGRLVISLRDQTI